MKNSIFFMLDLFIKCCYSKKQKGFLMHGKGFCFPKIILI